MDVKVKASVLSDNQFYLIAGVTVLGGYFVYRKIAKPVEAVAETVEQGADWVTGGDDDINFIGRAVNADGLGNWFYCLTHSDAPTCQTYTPGAAGSAPGAN